MTAVNLDRFRPRHAVARIPTMIGCWSAAGVVGALCGLRGWPAGVLLFVGVPLSLGLSVLVLGGEDRDSQRGRWWVAELFDAMLPFAVVVLVLTFGFSMLMGARLIVLDLWGEPTVVRVDSEDRSVSKHRGGNDEDFCYRVSRLDGSPVPGRICRESRDFHVGKPADVVIDPSGFSGPETPQAVAGVAVPRTVALGSFAALCLLAVIAGGGPPREPASPRPRSPDYLSRVISPRPGRSRSPRRRGRGRRPGAGRRR